MGKMTEVRKITTKTTPYIRFQGYKDHKGRPITEPSDERARYILTSKAKTAEREEFLYDYNQWLKSIGYYTEEPATEWLGHHYVGLILNRVVPSSESVKKACERFKWELSKQGTREFPYIWDEEAALNFIRFTEAVFHISTKESTKKPFILQPNQHFRLSQEFGWKRMNIDGTPGGPRFETYFDLIGRGNGKTTEKVPIAIYKMLQGLEVPMAMQYIAGTEELSKETFQKIREIVGDMGMDLAKEFKINQEEIHLYKPQTAAEKKRKAKRIEHGSKLRRASQSADSNHGGATYYVIFDEVHTYKSREIIDTIQNSFGKREGSMACFTSTRSADYSETLESFVEEGMDILDGYKTNSAYETAFYFLAYNTDLSDLANYKNWIIANPNIMFIAAQKQINKYVRFEKDRTDAAAMDLFTQQFNFVDTTAATAYLTDSDLKRNRKPVDLTLYHGKDAYLGIDLGGDDDFSYVVAMIPVVEKIQRETLQDGEYISTGEIEVKRIIVEGRGFITETNYRKKTVDNPRNFEDLPHWVRDGQIEIMPDYARNEEVVYRYIQELMARYNIKKIGADTRDFQYVKLRLEEDRKGHLIEKVEQKGSTLDSPLRGLQEVFKQGNVLYNNDPFLSYCFRNAQLLKGGRIGGDGLWTISKPTTSKVATARAKIDGLAALTDAFAVFLNDDGFAGKILKGGANVSNFVPSYKLFNKKTRRRVGGGKRW